MSDGIVMKAIHVEVPGSTRGALALWFPNAQQMGLFAMAMLQNAKAAQNIVCLNAPGQSTEQGMWNANIAGFEAISCPEYGVISVRAPLVTSRELVSMTREFYEARDRLVSMTPGNENGKVIPLGSVQAGASAQAGPSDAHMVAAVTQPWSKEGISENEWRLKRGGEWAENLNPHEHADRVIKIPDRMEARL